jgi:hypothetical protein
MPNVHDPYLETIRRSLNDEKIKSRKEKIKKIEAEKKSFLSQKITLSDYIYLPQELENLFLVTLFILVPYTFGLAILFMIAYNEFHEFLQLNFDMFMLTWTVGYESIAALLLLFIIKSALTFKQKTG